VFAAGCLVGFRALDFPLLVLVFELLGTFVFGCTVFFFFVFVVLCLLFFWGVVFFFGCFFFFFFFFF